MRTFFQYCKENRIIHYLIIFLSSCIIAIPLLRLQFLQTHDGILHFLRLIGTNLSLANTEFPHLIIPYFCNNLGYSINAFYAPLVTYLPIFLKIFVISQANVLKLFTYLTILFSGFTMYHATLEITKKRPVALVSSLIYMAAPYHLEDIYIRFALGEFTTFVFIPIVFQGLYNLLEGDGKKNFYIAIGAVGLVLSHSITTIYVAILCFLYLLMNFPKLKNIQIWKKIGINILWILSLTAFFWVILWEFQGFTTYGIMDPEIMRATGEYVADKAISITQFFIQPHNELSFGLGFFTIIGLLSGIFCMLKKKKDKTYEEYFCLGLICLFLCTNLFPWKVMPDILCKIQFPWRILGEFYFFASVVIAINLSWMVELLEKRRRIIFVIFMITIAILELALGLIKYLNKEESKLTNEKYEQSILNNPEISIHQINREYMPCRSLQNEDKINNRDDIALVTEGDAILVEQEKKLLEMKIKLEDAKKGTKIELPCFYYPGYEIKLITSHQELILEQSESEIGLIQITLPDNIEKGEIQVTYQGTLLERIAYGISLISCFTFIFWIIKEKKKNHGENDERKVKKNIRKERV